MSDIPNIPNISDFTVPKCTFEVSPNINIETYVSENLEKKKQEWANMYVPSVLDKQEIYKHELKLELSIYKKYYLNLITQFKNQLDIGKQKAVVSFDTDVSGDVDYSLVSKCKHFMECATEDFLLLLYKNGYIFTINRNSEKYYDADEGTCTRTIISIEIHLNPLTRPKLFSIV